MTTPLKGIFREMAGKFFRSPRVRHLDIKKGARAGTYNTPGLRNVNVKGTVPTKAQQDQVWADFTKAGGARDQFLDNVRKNASVTELQALGWTDAEIKAFRAGGPTPPGFQVHHVVPRKAGGGNEMDNLVLIRQDPDHILLTAAQNAALKGYKEGDAFDVPLPTVPPGHSSWPQPGTHPYKR